MTDALDKAEAALACYDEGTEPGRAAAGSSRPGWTGEEPMNDNTERDALVEAKRQAAMDAAWGFRHETRSALEKWTAQHWFDTGWRACAAALTPDGQEKNR